MSKYVPRIVELKEVFYTAGAMQMLIFLWLCNLCFHGPFLVKTFTKDDWLYVDKRKTWQVALFLYRVRQYYAI